MDTIKELYHQAEEKGRTVVESQISGKCENYEFTTYEFDSIDLFVTGYTDTVAIEIKYREKYSSDQVQALGGQVLEKVKYYALMEAYLASGYTPYFWVIYNDTQLLWDISKVEPNFIHTDIFPSSTVEHGDKTDKDVLYLDKKDAYEKPYHRGTCKK